MKQQHEDLLRLFHQNSNTLDWINLRKQTAVGIDYEYLCLDEMSAIKDRLRLIAKIPTSILIPFNNSKKLIQDVKTA